MALVTRVVAEGTVGLFLAAGVGAEAVGSLVAQAVTGPSAVFGGDVVWDWALLIAAGAIVYRAGKLHQRIDETERAGIEAAKAAADVQAEVNSGLVRRIESMEEFRRSWEPLMYEWKTRLGQLPEERRDAG